MSRPWQTWGAFGLCVSLLLVAMGWITHIALGLEQSERAARLLAAREENVRLALWRMESALAPLIAEESGRPISAYQAFYRPARAYTSESNIVVPEGVLVPSPLLTGRSSNIILHFQIEPDGAVTSPQAPTGKLRVLAVADYVSAEELDAAASRLDQLRDFVDGPALLASLRSVSTVQVAAAPVQTSESSLTQQLQSALAQNNVQQVEVQQQVRNYNELNARALRNRGNLANDFEPVFSSNGEVAVDDLARNIPQRAEGAGGAISIGLLSATWRDHRLLLVRPVSVTDAVCAQGCWLDWDRIRADLLSEIKDLLPNARLTPAEDQAAAPDPQVLAALPVRLEPGEVEIAALNGVSAIRVSLGIAWACVVLAALAVGVLLQGAVALSERRAAFVSAVTHEMRTPLTTFGIYTDMLLRDMVPSAEKRQAYLKTLRTESQRLVHLVENVLTSARLERRPERIHTEAVALGAVLERMRGRLASRADEAGMTLDWGVPEGLAELRVCVDASALEQILFNLVDNACKYAAGATERVVHVEAVRHGERVAIAVSDHGPGIRGASARRLFRPFCKSAREAAHTAPGVGLGLALSRRLARHMGGDLVLDKHYADGARMVVEVAVSC